ncbi:hypothetical protein L0F63_005602 [Massospora cicadina]|nr:hypothetical protein L0F63_005602 [Massospora cicadina]
MSNIENDGYNRDPTTDASGEPHTNSGKVYTEEEKDRVVRAIPEYAELYALYVFFNDPKNNGIWSRNVALFCAAYLADHPATIYGEGLRLMIAVYSEKEIDINRLSHAEFFHQLVRITEKVESSLSDVEREHRAMLSAAGGSAPTFPRRSDNAERSAADSEPAKPAARFDEHELNYSSEDELVEMSPEDNYCVHGKFVYYADGGSAILTRKLKLRGQGCSHIPGSGRQRSPPPPALHPVEAAPTPGAVLAPADPTPFAPHQPLARDEPLQRPGAERHDALGASQERDATSLLGFAGEGTVFSDHEDAYVWGAPDEEIQVRGGGGDPTGRAGENPADSGVFLDEPSIEPERALASPISLDPEDDSDFYVREGAYAWAALEEETQPEGDNPAGAAPLEEHTPDANPLDPPAIGGVENGVPNAYHSNPTFGTYASSNYAESSWDSKQSTPVMDGSREPPSSPELSTQAFADRAQTLSSATPLAIHSEAVGITRSSSVSNGEVDVWTIDSGANAHPVKANSLQTIPSHSLPAGTSGSQPVGIPPSSSSNLNFYATPPPAPVASTEPVERELGDSRQAFPAPPIDPNELKPPRSGGAANLEPTRPADPASGSQGLTKPPSYPETCAALEFQAGAGCEVTDACKAIGLGPEIPPQPVEGTSDAAQAVAEGEGAAAIEEPQPNVREATPEDPRTPSNPEVDVAQVVDIPGNAIDGSSGDDIQEASLEGPRTASNPEVDVAQVVDIPGNALNGGSGDVAPASYENVDGLTASLACHQLSPNTSAPHGTGLASAYENVGDESFQRVPPGPPEDGNDAIQGPYRNRAQEASAESFHNSNQNGDAHTATLTASRGFNSHASQRDGNDIVRTISTADELLYAGLEGSFQVTCNTLRRPTNSSSWDACGDKVEGTGFATQKPLISSQGVTQPTENGIPQNVSRVGDRDNSFAAAREPAHGNSEPCLRCPTQPVSQTLQPGADVKVAQEVFQLGSDGPSGSPHDDVPCGAYKTMSEVTFTGEPSQLNHREPTLGLPYNTNEHHEVFQGSASERLDINASQPTGVMADVPNFADPYPNAEETVAAEPQEDFKYLYSLLPTLCSKYEALSHLTQNKSDFIASGMRGISTSAADIEQCRHELSAQSACLGELAGDIAALKGLEVELEQAIASLEKELAVQAGTSDELRLRKAASKGTWPPFSELIKCALDRLAELTLQLKGSGERQLLLSGQIEAAQASVDKLNGEADTLDQETATLRQAITFQESREADLQRLQDEKSLLEQVNAQLIMELFALRGIQLKPPKAPKPHVEALFDLTQGQTPPEIQASSTLSPAPEPAASPQEVDDEETDSQNLELLAQEQRVAALLRDARAQLRVEPSVAEPSPADLFSVSAAVQTCQTGGPYGQPVGALDKGPASDERIHMPNTYTETGSCHHFPLGTNGRPSRVVGRPAVPHPKPSEEVGRPAVPYSTPGPITMVAKGGDRLPEGSHRTNAFAARGDNFLVDVGWFILPLLWLCLLWLLMFLLHFALDLHAPYLPPAMLEAVIRLDPYFRGSFVRFMIFFKEYFILLGTY